MSTIEQAEQRIRNLNTELHLNRAHISILDKEMRHLEERNKAISGTSWTHGELQKAKNELAKAKLEERDKTARPVVWKMVREYQCTGHRDYVVEKITKKRVYIRKKGCKSTSYYDRETGKGSSKYDGTIDLEATFPEGVENFTGGQHV